MRRFVCPFFRFAVAFYIYTVAFGTNVSVDAERDIAFYAALAHDLIVYAIGDAAARCECVAFIQIEPIH